MSEFIRPFESHVQAFDAGYDMLLEIKNGRAIKVADVQHMIKRLIETQVVHGRNMALHTLATELKGTEKDLDFLEQQSLIVE